MATAVLMPFDSPPLTAGLPCVISVEEYLHTWFRPDCDYVDGEIRERHVGHQYHAALQNYVAWVFRSHLAEWKMRGYTELRVQVAPTRFRVPDVCAHPPAIFPDGVLREAPTLCVEILSPGDTLGAMQERVDDYLALGVRNIWLIDPFTRRAWTADSDGFHPLQADAFTVPDTPVRMPLAPLWEELDSLGTGTGPS